MLFRVMTPPEIPKNKTIVILFTNKNKNLPLGEFIIREPFFRMLHRRKNKLLLMSEDLKQGKQLLNISPFNYYFKKLTSYSRILAEKPDVIINLQTKRYPSRWLKQFKQKKIKIYMQAHPELLFDFKNWKFVDYFPKYFVSPRYELQRTFDIFGITCNFNNPTFIPKINYQKKKIKYDYAINLLNCGSMKSWNTEKLIDFIEINKSKKMILIGDKNAKNQEKQILDAVKVKSEVGKQNLNKLIDTINISKTIITPDTGTAHLAAAMGKKVIVGYGPTEIERWKPLGKNVIQLYNKKGCRDCRETRFCKIRTRECMDIKLNCE